MDQNLKRLEQILTVVVLGLLVIGCFLVLRPFLAAMMWAAILAVSTAPLFNRLVLLFRGRATLAALALTLLLTAALVVPVVIVGTSLAANADELSRILHSAYDSGLPEPPGWIATIPLVGERLHGYLHGMAHDVPKLTEELAVLLRPLGAKLPAIGAALGEGLFELMLSLLIAFFLFRDGEPVREKVSSVAERLAGERGLRLMTVAHSTIVGVVYGILGTALAQGVLAGIGFAFAGVPAAPLLGLATFFLSVIPIGPPLVWAPAAAWLYFQGSTGWAIFIALWGLVVVSSVDNFLKPLLISRGSNLPFILVLLGVFGGVVAFGFVGVFLGPTLLAVGYRLLLEWAPRADDRVAAGGTSPAGEPGTMTSVDVERVVEAAAEAAAGATAETAAAAAEAAAEVARARAREALAEVATGGTQRHTV